MDNERLVDDAIEEIEEIKASYHQVIGVTVGLVVLVLLVIGGIFIAWCCFIKKKRSLEKLDHSSYIAYSTSTIAKGLAQSKVGEISMLASAYGEGKKNNDSVILLSDSEDMDEVELGQERKTEELFQSRLCQVRSKISLNNCVIDMAARDIGLETLNETGKEVEHESSNSSGDTSSRSSGDCNNNFLLGPVETIDSDTSIASVTYFKATVKDNNNNVASNDPVDGNKGDVPGNESNNNFTGLESIYANILKHNGINDSVGEQPRKFENPNEESNITNKKSGDTNMETDDFIKELNSKLEEKGKKDSEVEKQYEKLETIATTDTTEVNNASFEIDDSAVDDTKIEKSCEAGMPSQSILREIVADYMKDKSFVKEETEQKEDVETNVEVRVLPADSNSSFLSNPGSEFEFDQQLAGDLLKPGDRLGMLRQDSMNNMLEWDSTFENIKTEDQSLRLITTPKVERSTKSFLQAKVASNCSVDVLDESATSLRLPKMQKMRRRSNSLSDICMAETSTPRHGGEFHSQKKLRGLCYIPVYSHLIRKANSSNMLLNETPVKTGSIHPALPSTPITNPPVVSFSELEGGELQESEAPIKDLSGIDKIGDRVYEDNRSMADEGGKSKLELSLVVDNSNNSDNSKDSKSRHSQDNSQASSLIWDNSADLLQAVVDNSEGDKNNEGFQMTNSEDLSQLFDDVPLNRSSPQVKHSDNEDKCGDGLEEFGVINEYSLNDGDNLEISQDVFIDHLKITADNKLIEDKESGNLEEGDGSTNSEKLKMDEEDRILLEDAEASEAKDLDKDKLENDNNDKQEEEEEKDVDTSPITMLGTRVHYKVDRQDEDDNQSVDEMTLKIDFASSPDNNMDDNVNDVMGGKVDDNVNAIIDGKVNDKMDGNVNDIVVESVGDRVDPVQPVYDGNLLTVATKNLSNSMSSKLSSSSDNSNTGYFTADEI